jgi:integral membrane protein (TIGR01906 family)
LARKNIGTTNNAKRGIKRKKMKKTIKIAVIISMLIILTLGPLLFYSYNHNFYYEQMQKNNVYDKLGEEKAKNLVVNVIDFLKGGVNLSEEFDGNERRHMEDVKKLYLVATILFSIAAITIFIFLLLVFILAIPMKLFLRTLMWGFLAALILNIIIILFVLLNFSDAFILFHHIFFPQGNWQFPYDSLLITLFPEEFFTTIATRILLTSMILSALLLAATYTIMKMKILK